MNVDLIGGDDVAALERTEGAFAIMASYPADGATSPVFFLSPFTNYSQMLCSCSGSNLTPDLLVMQGDTVLTRLPLNTNAFWDNNFVWGNSNMAVFHSASKGWILAPRAYGCISEPLFIYNSATSLYEGAGFYSISSSFVGKYNKSAQYSLTKDGSFTDKPDAEIPSDFFATSLKWDWEVWGADYSSTPFNSFYTWMGTGADPGNTVWIGSPKYSGTGPYGSSEWALSRQGDETVLVRTSSSSDNDEMPTVIRYFRTNSVWRIGTENSAEWYESSDPLPAVSEDSSDSPMSFVRFRQREGGGIEQSANAFTLKFSDLEAPAFLTDVYRVQIATWL